VSDAQNRLRQYLEQRKELGESEFVLDSLSVEDALKVLGGKGDKALERGVRGVRGVSDADSANPANSAFKSSSAQTSPNSSFKSGPHVPESQPRDSEKRRAAETAAASGDWREALRNVDAGEPAAKAGAPSAAPSATPKPLSPEALKIPAAAPASPPSGQPITIAGARSGLDDLTSIEAVAKTIAGCQRCSLHASAKNPVPGEGNPQAKLVVVGEAPGATEDELGRPFVGKSGELLDKILGAINLSRADVFICNVLKHRPPGNRNPEPDEIHACRPYLLRQLELMNPKVILALGTFAAQTLLETDSPIGKLRGIEHRYHGIPLVATYHPAALLRNPNWKRPAWEDVQLARRIFDRA
jgi:uracil-DNA glycosylase family 4